jgi:peptidoglycan/xylan/chitin deacetylase (PgdA/CDA1 family)
MTFNKSFPNLTAPLIRAIGNTIAPRGKGQGKLCIVNYHRILESRDPLLNADPDIKTFRWQMELLADCFNVLPLYDAVIALRTQRMPPRAVCITFDDGYRSTHDLALPILRELNLPASVFVTTGYLGGGSMWNDTIIETVRNLHSARLDLREVGLGTYSLETAADRQHTIEDLTARSKYLPPDARFNLACKLEALVSDVVEHGPMLTTEMVRALANHGIEIGGHTISHPILTCIEDEKAKQEIVGCKEQLEAITGKAVRLFAYPNGKEGVDFNERHVAMAKEAGYLAAFTTSVGAASRRHDPYRMPRCCPWDSTPSSYAIRLLRWLAS